MAGPDAGTLIMTPSVSNGVVEAHYSPDCRHKPTPVEAAALQGITGLGCMGMPFAVLLILFSIYHAWQVMLACTLLLIGSLGLFLHQRWAAVLVCGICWFGLATYLFDPFPGARSPGYSLDELVYVAIHGTVAVLLTALPILCSRSLKNGLWTCPVTHRPAAVIAVLAGLVWLWFHLHALVEWESEGQARMRMYALILTTGAGLLALLCRRKSRQDR
jgi:hypothetical protein